MGKIATNNDQMNPGIVNNYSFPKPSKKKWKHRLNLVVMGTMPTFDYNITNNINIDGIISSNTLGKQSRKYLFNKIE